MLIVHRGRPVRSFVQQLMKSDKGATAVEYGLILSLIVIALLGALGTVATKTNVMWTRVSNEVNNH